MHQRRREVGSTRPTQHNLVNEKTLAIVVPVHEGDKKQALKAISSWPATCFENTLDTADLVIYKAEALRSGEDDLLSRVPMRASICFRRVRVVRANLLPEVGQRPHFADTARLAAILALARFAVERSLAT